MDAGTDADQVAASLARWLALLTVVDLSADEVTARIIDAVVEWAAGQGWRVYRRAASVLSLPPPYQRQRSVLDVACARPVGPPVVIEVDRTHRQRTVDKLLAEADAGRVAIWVRWGSGGFTAPPPAPPAPALRLVTFELTSRRPTAGTGRVYSRLPTVARAAPPHSRTTVGNGLPVALPMDPPDDGGQ
jgi:hypothetical protein